MKIQRQQTLALHPQGQATITSTEHPQSNLIPTPNYWPSSKSPWPSHACRKLQITGYQMRFIVRSVATKFLTAIISGRSRDKVYDLVGLSELYYAGSHGMDIIFPAKDVKTIDADQMGKEVNFFHPASEFLPMINKVFTKDIKASKVENHKFCVSNVDENSWPVIAQDVHDILNDYPRLRLTHGRKVLEVRPVIDWDKGKAVEFLLVFTKFVEITRDIKGSKVENHKFCVSIFYSSVDENVSTELRAVL